MVTCHEFKEGGSKYQARHLSANDYYDEQRRIEGRFVGKLCEHVGVERGTVVSNEAFEALSQDRHAITGEQIGEKRNTTRTAEIVDPVTGELKTLEVANRKELCDVVISAPKTFSIQAVLGGDDRVLEWHRRAVDKTVAEMERLAGRQAHNGKDHLERTGNFVAAAYEHDASRAQEAQLHTHCVVFNETRAANGKCYALEFREFFDQSKYLTALYRDELARAAREAGLELAVGDKGQPEIKALLGLAERYSTRSKQLEEMVVRVEEYAGTKLSNSEVAQLVRASRGIDLEKFSKAWDAKRQELAPLRNLDPETAERARRKLLKTFSNTVRDACEGKGKLKEISTPEVLAEQQSRMTREEREAIEALKHREALQVPRSPDLEESITYAIAATFERRSVARDYELYEEILKHAQGKGVNLDEMKAALAAHPDLVFAPGTRGEVTTAQHLQRELDAILWVEEGRGLGVALPSHGLDERLNPAQKAAIISLLSSDHRFTALSGAAGVGKTFAAASLIEKNVQAGFRVTAVAPSDEARNRLRDQAEGLPAGSAAGEALKRAESLQLFMASPKLRESLGPQDLLIVDEASMISVKQGHEVARWARERGARVLFMGDADQNVSVEAGDFFRVLLNASPLHTATLEEIIRQKPGSLDGHYLEAVKRFKAGKTTEAFSQLNEAGRIRELQGKDRIEAFAEALVRSEEEGRPAIATNPTHRENDAVAEAVRRRMHEKGQLTDERSLEVHRSLGWTQAQRREVNKIEPGQVLEVVKGQDKGRHWTVESVERGKVAAVDACGQRRLFGRQHAALFDVCEKREIKLAVGDRVLIRAGVRNGRGDFVNGERLTIAGWDKDGNPVSTDGRSITGRNLSYAYAGTTHAVEGATGLKVITGFDRHSVRSSSQKIAYVACSRGREDIEVFVESVADLSQIQNRTGERKAAVELEFEPGQHDRRTHVQELFRQLQRIKTNGAEVPRERVVEMCQKVAADLQEHAIKTPAEFRMEQMSAFEKDLWERAAAKYPLETRTPELQQRIERTITRKLEAEEHAKQHQAPEWHPGINPPGREQGRGYGYER